MDDLVEFLRARYDERAAKAEAAQSGPWVNEDGTVRAADGAEIVDWTSSAEHIAANDPKSVLDDIAAKRQILKLHRPYSVTTANDGLNWNYTRCAGCEPIDRELDPGESYWPCPNLRLLTLPFAGHPDYREEWKP